MIRQHPVLTTVTLVYLIVVGWITLGPQPVTPDQDRLISRIISWMHRHVHAYWITYPLVEFLANVAMFVPIGLLGLLLLGRRRWWIAMIAGALLSCMIEFTQLFLPGRVSDIRDIASNTTGAVLGVLIGLVVTAVSARTRTARVT